MITLIYGNGLTEISKKISEIKKRFEPLAVQVFSNKQTAFEQALIGLSSGGLFSDARLAILEDYDDKIDLTKILNDDQLNVVLIIRKNLTPSNNLLKQATQLKAQIFNFSEEGETNIFPFLDNLADKNPRAMQQLEDHFDEWGGQYILTMVFYMLRRMIQDPKKLPQFVQQKILKQKQNFPLEKITDLYKSVLETDYKIKSGLIEEKIGMTLLINKILT